MKKLILIFLLVLSNHLQSADSKENKSKKNKSLFILGKEISSLHVCSHEFSIHIRAWFKEGGCLSCFENSQGVKSCYYIPPSKLIGRVWMSRAPKKENKNLFDVLWNIYNNQFVNNL